MARLSSPKNLFSFTNCLIELLWRTSNEAMELEQRIQVESRLPFISKTTLLLKKGKQGQQM